MEHKMHYPTGFHLRVGAAKLLHRLSAILPSKYYTLPYAGGYIRVPLKDSYRMWAKVLGCYEYWKTRYILAQLGAGKTVVDVGSNVGYYTWLFAKLVGETGMVVGIDPEPELFAELERSLKKNRFGNVKLQQLALSSADGEMDFYIGKHSGWGSLLFSSSNSVEGKASIKVKVTTLDRLAADLGLHRIDLVKIDVESAELAVLQGAREILRTHGPDLLIDVDSLDSKSRSELSALLKEFGYRMYIIGKDLVEIDSVQEARKDILALREKSAG